MTICILCGKYKKGDKLVPFGDGPFTSMWPVHPKCKERSEVFDRDFGLFVPSVSDIFPIR